MRKAIGYCRVSTDKQEENTSLEDQKEKIKAFALSQSIEVIGIFQDTSSGTNVNRKGYQAALEFMVSNEVNCFIVAKFDRAHRNQLNLLSFQKELKEKGIAFVSVAELLDTSTPVGQLMFQILGSFAEFECNWIRERTVSGRKKKLEKLDKNESAGGRIPLGYDKQYQVVPGERDMVLNLFRWYLELGSLAKVKKKADSKGYTGRNGKSLSRQAIHIIITNRFYLGEYHYNGHKEKHGKLINLHHDNIVSKNLFGRVQNSLANNRK